MKVVLCENGKQAKIVDIDRSLEGMQKIVGGDIQATYPFDDTVALVCNEEGKIRQLPYNRAILRNDIDPDMHSIGIVDIIVGPFFICGLGEEEFADLTDEQAEKYVERFRYPEEFYRVKGLTIRAPYTGEE